jgi:hypothetical protein
MGKFHSMPCVKRDETVPKLPLSIFIEIISKFKIQVKEHVESSRSVMLYVHFLVFVVFYSRKASCAQYFRSSHLNQRCKELPPKTN